MDIVNRFMRAPIKNSIPADWRLMLFDHMGDSDCGEVLNRLPDGAEI